MIFIKNWHLKIKNLNFKAWNFKNLNFSKDQKFYSLQKSFKWKNTSQHTLQIYVWKCLKKSLKNNQNKPYIVMHWHATLNIILLNNFNNNKSSYKLLFNPLKKLTNQSLFELFDKKCKKKN